MTACLVLPTGREVYKRFLVLLSTFLLRGGTPLDFLSLVKKTDKFSVLSTPYDLWLEYWLISLPVNGFPFLVRTSHNSL